jgi:hypothetical protein
LVNLSFNIRDFEKDASAAAQAAAGLTPRQRAFLVRKAVQTVKRHALQNLRGRFLKVRSGTLFRWTSSQPVIVHGDGEVSWGLPEGFNISEYGAKNNSGGQITGNPLLRIPLPPALTGNKVDRNAFVQFRGMDPSARYKRFGLFFLKSKAGNLLLVKRGKDGGIEPWYLLRHSVNIPARPWFDDAIQMADLPNLIDELVEAFLEKKKVSE